MIEAILCDLCLLHLDPQYDALHFPLSNKVLRKASRYKTPVLGKTLPDLLNVMTAPEMDFLALTKGHKNFRIIDQDLNAVPMEGVQSTLALGPKLLSRIERFGITQEDIAWSDEQETILLRSTKRPCKEVAKAVEYIYTQGANTLRAEMNSINAYLAQADISCKYFNTNHNDRYLRRIFNNNSFDQGGRLYGGFWQRLTSEMRYEHIRINKDMIAECDYRQMSILLMYAEAGAQKQLPAGDLYDLSAFGIPQEYLIHGSQKILQSGPISGPIHKVNGTHSLHITRK